ncbi:uncharacterized protein LOC133893681 [Phragmites australis]|uniref:uncharacterized protein LOC133893681 n=1 Tax=Phragmites australis TaxID=29695 RepID=UPI002D798074|nr:uncharacterized protein LOC133893681 [Phragmites australis]
MTPCRSRVSPAARTRRCNAAAGRTPLGGVTARALAAGLWRLRHAERLQAAGPTARRHRQGSSSARALVPSPQQGRRRANHLRCHGKKRQFGVPSQCQCQCRNHHGILDKIEACVELPMPYSSSMEKATKWDRVYANHLGLDAIFGPHDPTIWNHAHHLSRSTTTLPRATVVLLLEAELDKARAQIGELEDERRVMRKRLERFLRKLAEDKAAWKSRMRDKAQHAAAALKEEARLERKHRRLLESANVKLMRELAEAKQQAQSYEVERKARELMEEACSELTREVEEDQAEVELLRRECLRMREEMEEERRMLQMAEVWREERVQMKLSDAKLALESKYSQLNRLQAEMESFLRNKDSCHSSALREARMIGEAAASSSLRSRRDQFNNNDALRHRQNDTPAEVDVDSVLVFEHFRRKESSANGTRSYSSPVSPASANVQSESPATDLFLAKVDDDEDGCGSSADLEYDGGRDSCSWMGTSDRSASVARASNGSGVTEAHSSGMSRRSGTKNTALIRRLWRSAISESRKKTGSAPRNGGGWSPSSDRKSTVAPPSGPVAGAAEQCSSSGPVNLPIRKRDAIKGHDGLPLPQRGGTQQHSKQSLKEKLMEARMDDHKDKPCHAAVKQKP